MAWVQGESWREKERERERERERKVAKFMFLVVFQVNYKCFLHVPPSQMGIFWDDPGFFPLKSLHVRQCCCWCSWSELLVGALPVIYWWCDQMSQYTNSVLDTDHYQEETEEGQREDSARGCEGSDLQHSMWVWCSLHWGDRLHLRDKTGRAPMSGLKNEQHCCTHNDDAKQSLCCGHG